MWDYHDITTMFCDVIILKYLEKNWSKNRTGPNFESSDYPEILRKERNSIFIIFDNIHSTKIFTPDCSLSLHKMSKLFIFPIFFAIIQEILWNWF